MDATIIRYFQAELFSRLLPSSYVGHVNLAAAKPWRFIPKWKDGSTVAFIIFSVKDFRNGKTKSSKIDPMPTALLKAKHPS